MCILSLRYFFKSLTNDKIDLFIFWQNASYLSRNLLRKQCNIPQVYFFTDSVAKSNVSRLAVYKLVPDNVLIMSCGMREPMSPYENAVMRIFISLTYGVLTHLSCFFCFCQLTKYSRELPSYHAWASYEWVCPWALTLRKYWSASTSWWDFECINLCPQNSHSYVERNISDMNKSTFFF